MKLKVRYIETLILIAPIIGELYMGYYTTITGQYSIIGQLVKGGLFLILLVYPFFYTKSKMLLFFALTIMIVNACLTSFNKNPIDEISIVIKLLMPFLVFEFLKTKSFKLKEIITVLLIFNFIICTSNLGYILTGNSNLTYSYSLGFTGIFNSTNDLIVCLMFNLFLCLFLHHHGKISSLTALVHSILILTLSLISGSRTGILICILFVVLKLILTLQKSLFKFFLVFSIIISVSTSILFKYEREIESLIDQSSYTFEKFNSLLNPDSSNYISPRQRGIKAALDLFNREPEKIIFGYGEDNFRSKIGAAMGYTNPLNGTKSKHIEVDPLDIIGYIGIISLIVYLILLFITMGPLKANGISIFIYFILFYSFIAGHVLVNTLLYLPFAIILFLNKNYKNLLHEC